MPDALDTSKETQTRNEGCLSHQRVACYRTDGHLVLSDNGSPSIDSGLAWHGRCDSMW